MNIKKRHIIEVAFSLFYQNGIHATGINEIIKTSGVAKKTLYNHFASKEELIIATVIYRDQLEINHLQSELEKAETGKDAVLILFEVLDNYIKHRDASLGHFKGDYFNNSAAEYGHLSPLLSQACQKHKIAVKKIIQMHVDSFETNPQKNQFIVNAVILMKEGVLTDALVNNNPNSALQAMTYIENLLRFKR